MSRSASTFGRTSTRPWYGRKLSTSAHREAWFISRFTRSRPASQCTMLFQSWYSVSAAVAVQQCWMPMPYLTYQSLTAG